MNQHQQFTNFFIQLASNQSNLNQTILILLFSYIIMKETRSKPKELSNLIDLKDNTSLSLVQKLKITNILEGMSFVKQSDQMQYLLDKKERQKIKRKKIKQIEQQFQNKRLDSIKKIQDKVTHSEQVKNKALKQKLSKTKKNLEHYEKVKNKAIHQNQEDLQKHLQKRKQFQSEQAQNERQHQKNHNQNNNLINHKRSISHNQSLTLSRSQQKTDQQMKRIDIRIKRAKTNNKFYKDQVIQKIKQRENYVDKIQGKIKQISLIQQQSHYKEYYRKVQHILTAKQKIKVQKQKFVNDKKKSFSDKLQKLHQNLKYLESQQNQKFEELQQKMYKEPLNSTNTMNSSNRASYSHRQRVLLNHKRLQQEKNKKAEEILHKHLQITLKNKAYKQGKDKIYQAMNKKQTQEELQLE